MNGVVIVPERGRRGPIGEKGDRGYKGETGPAGINGKQGEVGPPGRDATLVPSVALFDRDPETHLTTLVQVMERSTGALLATLRPIRDESDFIDVVEITPA